MITQEKLEKEKLSLHIKYISGISFGCICLVIILSFCESTMFQNCISVASTVSSIILSAVAIVLSVTGERTTNEIRNKVSDSVSQLEDCTQKSGELTQKSCELNEELTRTFQQLRRLCEDMNDNVVEKFPNIQEALNDLISRSDKSDENKETISDNAVDHIVRFLNVINPKTKEYVKKGYTFFEEEAKKHPIEMSDVMQYLVNEGADVNTATLVIGLMLGILCTGAITHNNKLNELIERL